MFSVRPSALRVPPVTLLPSACSGDLTSLSLDCTDSGPHALSFSGRRGLLSVLLHTFEARLDARDPATGSGAVHLLLRETLSSGDRGRAARSPGGAVSVEGVERFRIEPELEMLLRASKAQGFCGDAADVEADPQTAASSRGSLLDVKDNDGRTPLVSRSACWSVHD